MIWEILASDSLRGRGREGPPGRAAQGASAVSGVGCLLCFCTWEEQRWISLPASNISYTHTHMPRCTATGEAAELTKPCELCDVTVRPRQLCPGPWEQGQGKRRWPRLQVDAKCSTGLVFFWTRGKPIKPQKQGELGWVRQNKHPRSGISSSKPGKGL